MRNRTVERIPARKATDENPGSRKMRINRKRQDIINADVLKISLEKIGRLKSIDRRISGTM